MTYKLILISHGEFANGLKDALEMIIGKQKFIESYGLPVGGNPNDLIGEIAESISNDETTVFLSDLIGGSMHNATVPLINNENVFLVGGMNLALAMQVALMKPTTAEEIDQQIDEAKNAFERIVIQDVEEEDFFA